MDVEQVLEHWRVGSAEDFAAAVSLASQHPRHALFFAHLALEKMLKAHVTRATADVPPRIHDLLRLADLGGVTLTAERREFLARFQQYCLAGRYPDVHRVVPQQERVQSELNDAGEMLQWLQSQLR